MPRQAVRVLIVGFMLLGQAGVAAAQDPIHKMGRGLVNVITSWLEIPKQLHLGAQEPQPLQGVGQGIVRGVSLTALRLGVGVYEAVTFPLPYPKDFASPYSHMEVPDYSWE